MHKEMRFLLRLWVDSSQDGSWRVSLLDIKESERRLSFKSIEALNAYLNDLTSDALEQAKIADEIQEVEEVEIL